MATNLNFEKTKELLTKCRANVDAAMSLFDEPSDLGSLGVPVPAVLAALASDKAAAEADLAARVKEFEERVQAFEEEKRLFQQQHDARQISLTISALNDKIDKVIRSSENTTAMLGQDGPIIQAIAASTESTTAMLGQDGPLVSTLKAQQQVNDSRKAIASTAEVSGLTLAKKVEESEKTLASLIHETAENTTKSLDAVVDKLQKLANDITQGVAHTRSATATASGTESSKDAMLDSIKEACDVMMEELSEVTADICSRSGAFKRPASVIADSECSSDESSGKGALKRPRLNQDENPIKSRWFNHRRKQVIAGLRRCIVHNGDVPIVNIFRLLLEAVGNGRHVEHFEALQESRIQDVWYCADGMLCYGHEDPEVKDGGCLCKGYRAGARCIEVRKVEEVAYGPIEFRYGPTIPANQLADGQRGD